MIEFAINFKDRFHPGLALLGWTMAAICCLFAITYWILFRKDGSGRWGWKPSQSALLRIFGNILNGRNDPELPWQWYDYAILMVLAAIIVIVMGWW